MKGISTALIVCALGFAVHGPAAEAQTERVVYSFAGSPDGAASYSGMIKVKGPNQRAIFYGLTGYGGSGTFGTVFALNPGTGAETVLYSFQNNGTDGWIPVGDPINVNGTLYGMTKWGGDAVCDCGTVFSFNLASGTEKVLYSFRGGTTDGSFPAAGVIYFKGKLYGTAFSDGPYRGGIAFSVDPNTGAETVLHSFGSGTDGIESPGWSDRSQRHALWDDRLWRRVWRRYGVFT